jgi:cell division protein FtsQ
MKFKLNIRREVTIVAALIVLFGLIAFTERMKGEVTVSAIRISLDNIHDNHYLEEKDIMKLMRLNLENLRGASLSKLNFSEIEQRIRESPYVNSAELYSDLKGNLMVNVSLRRPIARIVQREGPDAYVGDDGTIMPVSDRFSSRVILLSGEFIPKILKLDNIQELDEGRQLMQMVEMIREDPFWSAQIAQIDINAKAKTVLYLQVGDETIEFGKPDNLETKFKKLRIFYKEILPRVGWNKYDRINVEYEGQVVAE